MLEYITNYFAGTQFQFHLELLLRIFISLICGAAIGIERKNRGKGAGTRTHSIVAIASCLLMIISQYGFQDFLSHYQGTGVNINHDPSRIAAQIVTGIGFLGSGMIFVHKKAISGLTTAAGIWATAGIGMAVGAGMYFLSISTTIIIVIVQIIFHKNLKLFNPTTDVEIFLTVKNKDAALEYTNLLLEENDFHINNIEVKFQSDNLFDIFISASLTGDCDKIALANKFYQSDTIISVKI